MTADEINRAVEFLPRRDEDQLPALQFGEGPVVFAYAREIGGTMTLVVTIDTASVGDFPALSNKILGSLLPVRINVNGGNVFDDDVEVGE